MVLTYQLWENMHNIKFTIFTIFKCAIWCCSVCSCCAASTAHLQDSSQTCPHFPLGLPTLRTVSKHISTVEVSKNKICFYFRIRFKTQNETGSLEMDPVTCQGRSHVTGQDSGHLGLVGKGTRAELLKKGHHTEQSIAIGGATGVQVDPIPGAGTPWQSELMSSPRQGSHQSQASVAGLSPQGTNAARNSAQPIQGSGPRPSPHPRWLFWSV